MRSAANLREGLLSLVHSYSLLENKLDRHEQRERALGEVLKRGLLTLQKGQKIFEPMRGTFARLDERMSQMETILLSQNEVLTEQQVKVSSAVDAIMKFVADRDNLDATKPTLLKPPPSTDDSEETEDLAKKIEDLSDNVKRLRQEIGEMAADKMNAEAAARGLIGQAEKLVNSKLSSADEVIARLEDKLTNFYVTGPAAPTTTPAPVRDIEWETNVTSTLQTIRQEVSGLKETGGQQLNELAKALEKTTTALQTPPKSNENGLDRAFFVTLANETLEAIGDMRIEVLAASDKSFAKISTRLKEATGILDTNINEILKTITEGASTTEHFYETVTTNFEKIQLDVRALAKLETILLETGDNVLAIKRGMEFNVHALSLEIGDVVKSSAKELNSTVHKRLVVESPIINYY